MVNRESWVDYAKAIGIILVVYGHVASGLFNGGIDFPVSFYQISNSVIYSFHMPLFFFLSGLFFYNSLTKKGGTRLIFSKIDTIFYPYVLWSILQGGIEVLLSSYTTADVTVVKVASLLWSPRAQFWFLYALFTIFILSSLVYSLIAKKFTPLIFICSVAMYLYPSLLPQSVILEFISSNFVFFVLGIVFTMYLKVEYFSSVLALFGLVFTFCLGQWVFHEYLSYQYTDTGIAALLLAFISIAFVVSLSSLISQGNYKWFAYIGSSSMAIYLMHILAGSGSRIILSKVLGVESYVLHLVIGSLVGVLVPLIALFLINKFKVKYLFAAPISSMILNSYNRLAGSR